MYVNQKHRGKPVIFHDKCSGFFYMHYFNNLAHETYGLTSHLKDEEIMVKCLAQGHKCCEFKLQAAMIVRAGYWDFISNIQRNHFLSGML